MTTIPCYSEMIPHQILNRTGFMKKNVGDPDTAVKLRGDQLARSRFTYEQTRRFVDNNFGQHFCCARAEKFQTNQFTFGIVIRQHHAVGEFFYFYRSSSADLKIDRRHAASLVVYSYLD